jgi:hypothetical protein
MLARWDALLLAATVAGGSMLIENSHRLDTGAPDDDVVAIHEATCANAQRLSMRHRLALDDDGESGQIDEATADAPSECSDE